MPELVRVEILYAVSLAEFLKITGRTLRVYRISRTILSKDPFANTLDSPATWAQILTVLGRFVEPQELPLQHIQYDGWARSAIETAVALGWIEDSAEIDPNAVITRGDAVTLINTVLMQYK